MTVNWISNIDTLHTLLKSISVLDGSGQPMNQDAGCLQWREKAIEARKGGKTLFFAGNGASASLSSHFAADLQKNCRIRTQVFTDLSLITAYANDISYEEVFSGPLSLWMKKGDLLITISSSGESPNVVRAARAARDMGGFVVTLSAMKEENTLRRLGHLNFYVPAKTYGMAETVHAALLHYWTDGLLRDDLEFDV